MRGRIRRSWHGSFRSSGAGRRSSRLRHGSRRNRGTGGGSNGLRRKRCGNGSLRSAGSRFRCGIRRSCGTGGGSGEPRLSTHSRSRRRSKSRCIGHELGVGLDDLGDHGIIVGHHVVGPSVAVGLDVASVGHDGGRGGLVSRRLRCSRRRKTGTGRRIRLCLRRRRSSGLRVTWRRSGRGGGPSRLRRLTFRNLNRNGRRPLRSPQCSGAASRIGSRRRRSRIALHLRRGGRRLFLGILYGPGDVGPHRNGLCGRTRRYRRYSGLLLRRGGMV